MAEQFYTRRKRISGINIVPLIDVMTVLIFFFLMSMKFDEIKELGITPPAADSATQTQQETRLVVAVNAKGEFFVNAKPVPAIELAAALASAAEAQKTKTVVLVADEESAVRNAVFVVNLAQKCGLAVKILTRNENE